MNSKQLRERYSDLFQDIGKLKDFQVKLHIDTSIPPDCANCASTSIPHEKKVAAALETLERQDIIERVEVLPPTFPRWF